MYDPIAMHALACPVPGRIRIWLGVFATDLPEQVTWTLGGLDLDAAAVEAVRPLAHVDPEVPELRTHSGVFDIDVSGVTGPSYTLIATAAWTDGRREVSLPFTTRPVPKAVPTQLTDSFNLLLVSCFYEPKDSFGKAGSLVGNLLRGANRPDLVLTVGDQVYLDNPPQSVLRLTRKQFGKVFETKYRKNWQGSGYAQILRAAPVAAIPDDHEYWNNYPNRGPSLWPSTWSKTVSEQWAAAASTMYDAFQLGSQQDYSYVLDVDPLSIYLMDNRTFREPGTVLDGGGRTLTEPDLGKFNAWVDEVIATGKVPVLVTGPSLFQPARNLFKRFADLNFADCADYPEIMRGVLKLSANGQPPLTLTGDVHYGRVLQAVHATGNPKNLWSTIPEVISSPASIVLGQQNGPAKRPDRDFRVPGTDSSSPATLSCQMTWPYDDVTPVGNHVALLKFRRTRTTVTVDTEYWMTDDPSGATPQRAPRITLPAHSAPEGTI